MSYLPTLGLAIGLMASPLAAQLPVGSQAPEIEAGEWFNEPVGTSLEDLRGRVVFIEFWATW
jgi:thiol-disulfide isomerase/thioredoxin